MDASTTAELLARLTRDAERVAQQFGLRYRSIDPERPNVRRRYGICYSDGSIRIRLFHATTGRPLRYSSLVNTLCHELAHLRHFNHGKRFQRFYERLLAYAREEGIYRPGAPVVTPLARSSPPPALSRTGGSRGPEQLRLFG